MTRLSSREVDDRAAEWVARIEAGELTPQEDAALQAWLDEDARHFGAYAKARAVLAHTDRARALGPDFDINGVMESNARPTAQPMHTRRSIMRTGSIAASVAVLGSGGFVANRILRPSGYATQIGETRVVPLEDGSIVTLNTNSKIEVSFTPERRDVRLVQGEALFDVAKNKKRPFIVDANGTAVRAVGTSFTVTLLPDQPVRVLVREGKVEISRPKVSVAPPVYLNANAKAVAPADAPIQVATVAPSDVTRALSWRIGRLSFEGEPLGEAAATFARYSDVRIEIGDTTVARETVTGLFVSNDPVGFSKAVALSLGLRAEVRGNVVRLTRQ